MTRDALSDGSANALPELTSGQGNGGPALSLDDLAELALEVHVPLGTVHLDLRDFLELEVGSVIQTNRQTGEPLEISVNGTPIAKGEVRIQGERFAVRLTEILRATSGRDAEGAERHAPEDAPTP